MFCIGDEHEESVEALLSLLGEKVSASTVSEVARRLEDAVRGYHRRKLGDEYRFLFFDGVVLKQKGVCRVEKKMILCAYGVGWDGEEGDDRFSIGHVRIAECVGGIFKGSLGERFGRGQL